MSGTKPTGVYPCYENQFQIGSAKSNIADMVGFSVAFDNGVEEWNPYDQKGWVRRLMTTKSVTISVTGKRNMGDVGNDLVASHVFDSGTDSQEDFQWTFPDGTIVLFENAVISVTSCGAGETGNVAPLEFEVMSNGKPTVTPAV